MPLTGTFPRAVDEKRRVAIPKRLRPAGPEGAVGLFLAPGTDGCLSGFTEDVFQGLATRLSSAPAAHEDVRAFHRLFYAQAEWADIDGQGRLRIPDRLAEMAGLTDSVVVVGVLDRIEFWNPSRWDEYVAARSGRFDTLAQAASELSARGNPG